MYILHFICIDIYALYMCKCMYGYTYSYMIYVCVYVFTITRWAYMTFPCLFKIILRGNHFGRTLITHQSGKTGVKSRYRMSWESFEGALLYLVGALWKDPLIYDSDSLKTHHDVQEGGSSTYNSGSSKAPYEVLCAVFEFCRSLAHDIARVGP